MLVVAVGLLVLSVGQAAFGVVLETDIYLELRVCNHGRRSFQLELGSGSWLLFRLLQRPPELQPFLSLRFFDLRELSARLCVFGVAIRRVAVRMLSFGVSVFVSVGISMAMSVPMHFMMQLVLEVDSVVVVAGLFVVDPFEVFDFKLSEERAPFFGSSL